MWIIWTSTEPKQNATTFLVYTLANMAGLLQLPNRMPLISHYLYPSSLCTGNSGRKPPITVQKMGLCRVYHLTCVHGISCFFLVFLIISYNLWFQILQGWFNAIYYIIWLSQYHWNDPKGYRLNWQITNHSKVQTLGISIKIYCKSLEAIYRSEIYMSCNSVITWTILSKKLTMNIPMLPCEANIWGLFFQEFNMWLQICFKGNFKFY